jgi:hypothetical protein
MIEAGLSSEILDPLSSMPAAEVRVRGIQIPT